MTANTKPHGWSKEEIEASRRIAERTGRTLEEVQQESIARLLKFSARGALYRAKIVSD